MLMLSGREPRDEMAAMDRFGTLLAGEASRFGAAAVDYRRFDRRPLLITVNAPEAIHIVDLLDEAIRNGAAR